MAAMASNLPIPAPPRTPTPPLDDGEHEDFPGMGLDGFGHSPVKGNFDPSCLSPMDENFPIGRHGSTSAFPPPSSSTIPLSPTDTNTSSHYSPMSLDSASSQGSILAESTNGVFKFQPTSLATSPVAKSVSNHINFDPQHELTIGHRMLASDEGTSTSTAVYPTRFSSSQRHERPSPFPTPSLSPHGKNVARACPESKRCASYGASFICLSQPTLFGVLKVLSL